MLTLRVVSKNKYYKYNIIIYFIRFKMLLKKKKSLNDNEKMEKYFKGLLMCITGRPIFIVCKENRMYYLMCTRVRIYLFLFFPRTLSSPISYIIIIVIIRPVSDYSERSLPPYPRTHCKYYFALS